MNRKHFTFSIILGLWGFIAPAHAQLLWSDPATWPGGIKPVAGQDVVIPMGTTIILNESPPPLGGITVMGKLEFAHRNISLTTDWIMVHGTLEIGTVNKLFMHQATITLTGNANEDVMGMGSRGIMVMGGKLEIHGASPRHVWTKINQHAPLGATNLVCKDWVGALLFQATNPTRTKNTTQWKAGDEIAIAPTDYYLAGGGTSVTQKVSLATVSRYNLTINAGLNAHRWGLLQYATPSGLTTDPLAPLVDSPQPDTDSTTTPKILDERAVVGHLTRFIVIQSLEDSLWANEGFGAHIMIMGTGAEAHVEGLEIRRGGQRNRLGRYAFHWHMLSYNGAATLADASGQYIRNSVVNVSANRGIVIHGTNGLTIRRNVLYNITGHGIFTEDAVERRNLIDSNAVMMVRNTYNSTLPFLKVHESNTIETIGSSGFWISNPDNVITNNIAGDCAGFGFWLTFPTHPFGQSSNVLHTDGLLLNPSRLLFGVFDNNTAHSNRNRGIMLDLVEQDPAGNVFDFQYQSTTDGRNLVWPFATLRRFALSRYKVWKNGMSGIWDRAAWPDNLEVVSADNCGRFFAGSGAEGVIERSLVVGTSLNHLMNGTDRPLLNDALGGNQTPAAFATYHSAFDIKNNIVMHFPEVENTRSGAFATEDYYIRPVEKGQIRNVGNHLIETHPGMKLYAQYPHFTLAGVLWDPHGTWNNSLPDTNSYFVYDNPFFTYGQVPAAVPSAAGVGAGGVLVQGPFYGFNDFVVNQANDPYQDLMEIQVQRLDNNMNMVGTWEVEQAGDASWILAHMRHFAAHPNGYYRLDFPTIDTVADLALSVENMPTAADTLIIGIEYSGGYTITQVYTSSFPNFMDPGHANWPTSYAHKHVYQPLNSFNEVVQSPTESYWHDKTNNIVWVKIKGGIQQMWNDIDFSPTSEERLYRLFHLRVFGTPTPPPPPAPPFASLSLPQPSLQPMFFPNPCQTHITLSIPPTQSAYPITLTDVLGRTVLSMPAAPQVISVQHLPAGTYWLQIGATVSKITKE